MIGKQDACGQGACHLEWCSEGGGSVLAANYTSGSIAAFPLTTDASPGALALGPATDSKQAKPMLPLDPALSDRQEGYVLLRVFTTGILRWIAFFVYFVAVDSVGVIPRARSLSSLNWVVLMVCCLATQQTTTTPATLTPAPRACQATRTPDQAGPLDGAVGVRLRLGP